MAPRLPRRPDRDDEVVGRTGRVTGAIAAGLVGEVVLPIRGGSETFNAYPYLRTDEYAVGDVVVVVEYAEPRTVYVSAAR